MECTKRDFHKFIKGIQKFIELSTPKYPQLLDLKKPGDHVLIPLKKG